MPYKGLPACDCSISSYGRVLYRDYWLIKECLKYYWIQCRHCGEVRKTFSKGAWRLDYRPRDWQELLEPLPQIDNGVSDAEK